MGLRARFRRMLGIGTLIRNMPVERTPAELFALGAAVAFYPGRALASAAFACSFLAAGAGVSLLAFAGRRVRARAFLIAAFAAGLSAGAGAVFAELAVETPIPPSHGTLASLGARLVSDSQATGSGGRSLSVVLESMRLRFPAAEGTVLWPRAAPRATVIAGRGALLETGTEIAVEAPRPASAPGLFFADRISIAKGYSPGAARRFRSVLRGACLDAVDRVSGSAAGLAKALLLGVRGDLDVAESAAFKDSGCAHVLSLSGQHLSILCALAVAVLSRVAGKARAAKASIVLACAFVWLAGLSPSLLRSVLMLLLGEAVAGLDRRQKGASILAIAFAIGLAADPPSARSLSFVLSHLAMAGLAILVPRCSYILSRRVPPFLEKSLSASLAAIAFTAPVSVAVFGRLAPVGILASAASGPLVLALMWWIIGASFLCAFLPFLAPYCAPATEILHSLLLLVMEVGARVPGIVAAAPFAKAAACAVVAAFCLYVYARPYADYLKGAQGAAAGSESERFCGSSRL